MKRNLITTLNIVLFAGTILTSCKKENASAESTVVTNDLQVGNNSSCKLTHAVYPPAIWDFTYNDKGLADIWTIDFFGSVSNFKLEYDEFNKLIKADIYDDLNNLSSTVTFTYRGNILIKEAWSFILSGTSLEYLVSHNNKGQISKWDDIAGDTHILNTYDNMGNCTRSDYYIGSDLYFSDIYEFNSPVRDPELTVSGVDFLFPYSGGGYFNKLWFTRNLSIVYFSDGSSLTLNDLNASETDFSFGAQNFPTSVNYFDKASGSAFDITFGYSCNGNSNNAFGGNKTDNSQKPTLLDRSGKSIKEQLLELRQENSK
ncbi:MAG TPA: hypothetical protein VEV83_13615 [Parafilimonas sp.]|nr:hypothetical protein [Parafilimonas sp.]